MSTRKLLTADEAATYINRPNNWLAKQRCFGGGPVFVKLGRRVFYDLDDLDAWIAKHKRNSTSATDNPDWDAAA